MKLLELQPEQLTPNPWNSNHVDFENMDRLRAALLSEGWVKPVLARSMPDGSYQIIGGQHRVEIARDEPALQPVPTIVFDDMDDDAAKRAGMIDNVRYGEDDERELAALLESIDKDFALDLLPVDLSEIALLSTEVEEGTDEEIDDLLSGDKTVEAERAEKKPPKEFRVVRFKLASADAASIEALINKTKSDNGFDGSDKLTNDGDALAHLLLTETD